MITTVTLNPSIDREYFVSENAAKAYIDIYSKDDIKITPGGKGLIAAINLKKLGYENVQNIGFIGGKQGLFFEKMVQDFDITTNYVYTKDETRNNIKIVGENTKTYSHYNDYTYEVDSKNEQELLKRFKRSITDSQIVIIAGSIPNGVDKNIYCKLLSICNDYNKDVYIRVCESEITNILKYKPKIVSPYFKNTNFIDSLKTQEDYINYGKSLIDNGAQYVVVPYKCGKLILDKNEVYEINIENYYLTSYLGSGDAFIAAFVYYSLKNGFNFVEASRYGAAATFDVVQSKKVFISSRESILKLINEVKVNKVV